MPSFNARSGRIYFEQRGARANPPVLLIHGAGCQLVQWPESFIDAIVAAGYRAIVLDNRGVGLSDPIAADAPTLEQLMALAGDPGALAPAVSLSDLAADTVDLLDHVGQSGAHVIGVSMGGMIGQRMAIEHPQRVHSLTSLMSSSGNPELPQPSGEAIAAIARTLTATDRDEAIAANRDLGVVVAGPHYDSAQYGIARFAERAYERSFRPEAGAHHFAAVASDGDRRDGLSKLTTAVLAIHGKADPLVAYAASEDIAAVTPNCTLQLIDDMGHDLSEPLIEQIAAMIAAHLDAVEVTR